MLKPNQSMITRFAVESTVSVSVVDVISTVPPDDPVTLPPKGSAWAGPITLPATIKAANASLMGVRLARGLAGVERSERERLVIISPSGQSRFGMSNPQQTKSAHQILSRSCRAPHCVGRRRVQRN